MKAGRWIKRAVSSRLFLRFLENAEFLSLVARNSPLASCGQPAVCPSQDLDGVPMCCRRFLPVRSLGFLRDGV